MPLEHPKNSQSLILAGVFAAVTSSIWLIQYQHKKNKKTYDDEEWEQVRLSHLETSDLLFGAVEGISTLTWYTGDIMQAQETLMDQVLKLSKANPWLLGRLIRSGKNDISMLFPKEISSKKLGDTFQVLSKADISRNKTLYQELPNRLKQLGCLVGPGSTVVDKDECIFKVRLIPDSLNEKRFALVVSLAHCVGDGHTYYLLYKMLSENAPIQALDPVRQPILHDKIATALGGQTQADFLENPPPGFMFRFVKGILSSTFFGPTTKVELFWINHDWIQMEKEQAKANSGVSYVSTNDIVTCRFFQVCDMDQGTISIGFRDKIPGCESNMAGNYFNFLILRPGDWDSPVDIRKSIQEIDKGTYQPKLPRMTSWEHFLSNRLVGATSNWTTFCKPCHIQNCQEDLHIPVIPCDSQSVPARVVTGMYLFRPHPNESKVAAMFAGAPDILEALKESGMVGPSVL